MGIISDAMKKQRVDIIKIKAVNGEYHAVEQDGTQAVLKSYDTQLEAIVWAESNGYAIHIHRERNMKPSDRHGQFRHA